MIFLPRLAYRVLLRMHPHAFRCEFGDEMLWIFDEESRRGHALPLLMDGLRSATVQRIARAHIHPDVAEGYYREINAAIPLQRFTQAASILLLIWLFLLVAVSRTPGTAFPTGQNFLFVRISLMPSVDASRSPTQ